MACTPDSAARNVWTIEALSLSCAKPQLSRWTQLKIGNRGTFPPENSCSVDLWCFYSSCWTQRLAVSMTCPWSKIDLSVSQVIFVWHRKLCALFSKKSFLYYCQWFEQSSGSLKCRKDAFDVTMCPHLRGIAYVIGFDCLFWTVVVLPNCMHACHRECVLHSSDELGAHELRWGLQISNLSTKCADPLSEIRVLRHALDIFTHCEFEYPNFICYPVHYNCDLYKSQNHHIDHDQQFKSIVAGTASQPEH